MANRYIKKELGVIIHQRNINKIIMRYQHSIEMTNKIFIVKKYFPGMGKSKMYSYCWWKCKLMEPL